MLTSRLPEDQPCPHCGAVISEHIGQRPCVVSPPRHARGLYDLPIFGWAWREDGKDLRA